MGYVEDLRALIGHKRVILAGSVVILSRSDGKILLQQRRFPRGRWGLPGGLMELGESFEETARREVLEETGIIAVTLKLLGVYSGKDYLCRAENGDEWYVVTAAFTCGDFTGDAIVNDAESLALEWFDVKTLPEDIVGTHKTMIADFARSLEI